MSGRDFSFLADDPALNEPLGNMVARANALPLSNREEPKRQPHGALKHRCRQALVQWRKGRGLQAVLIPVQNVRQEIKGRNGRSTGKSFMTGRIGAGDDTWLCGGIAFSIEYKYGNDTQRDTQKIFQERWEASGGVYLIVRSPEQMIAGVEAALKARGNG